MDLIPDEWRITIDDRCIVLWRNKETTKVSGPNKGETVLAWTQIDRYSSTPEYAASIIRSILIGEQADTTTVDEFIAGLTAAVDRITVKLVEAGAVLPKLVAAQEARKEARTNPLDIGGTPPP